MHSPLMATITNSTNLIMATIHFEEVLDNLKCIAWKWLLARKSNSFSLFYEWCANPLDCIIRWFLFGVLFLAPSLVFLVSAYVLVRLCTLSPVCGWSTSCTFSSSFIIYSPFQKKKQNIKVMIMEKCFYN
jgi:hypothetical protein